MKSFLRSLSTREKILIICALFILIAFLIYQIVFLPMLRTKEELQQQTIQLEHQFSTFKIMAEHYLADKSRYETVKGELEGKKSLSVLTYLEDQSSRAGIRNNIEYIRPGGSKNENGVIKTSVEMKIDAISVRSLLEFLASLERNRKGLIVSYLRLKPFFKDREKIDVIVGITDVIME
ncbi:MAG: type II secretion system protein GspM [Spirochaetota bacterium]